MHARTHRGYRSKQDYGKSGMKQRVNGEGLSFLQGNMQEGEEGGDLQVRAHQDSPSRKNEDAASKKRTSESVRDSLESNRGVSGNGSKKRKVDTAVSSSRSGGPGSA